MRKVLLVLSILILVAVAAVVFVSLREGGGSVASGYRAVSVLILEGPFKTYGENVRAGIELALDEVRELEKVDFAVNFVSFDGDPSRALEKIKTAVERDGHRFVLEVFGTAAALESVDYLNEHKVLAISGVDTGHLLTDKAGKYFFRIIPSDGEAVKALLQWGRELGLDSATIVAVNTDWGNGIKAMVQHYAKQYAMTLGETISVDPSHTVFDPQVASLKAAGAKGVVLALNPDQAGNFARSLRATDFTTTVLGTDNLTAGEFSQAAGSAASGFRYVLPPQSPGSQTRAAVVEKLRGRLRLPAGEEPHPFALYGYDAAWTLFRAIKGGGQDPEAAATFLRSYSGNGATGPIAFTERNDLKLTGDYQRFEIRADPSTQRLAATQVER